MYLIKCAVYIILFDALISAKVAYEDVEAIIRAVHNLGRLTRL
jgi:hypothetical protein